MRIRVYFPDKPEEDVRRVMKSNGFRWSPSVGAWQRDLSQAGQVSLDRAMREIARIAGEEYGMTGTSVANRKSKTGGWTRTGVGRWVMQTPDTVFTLAHTKGSRRSADTWDVMAESRKGTTRMSFPSRENAEYYVEQMMRKGGGRR